MKIEQKKLSNKLTFSFDTETFNFAYQDKSGSGDFDIPYIDFPLKPLIKIEQNDWLRNVGYIWCALGVIQIGYALSIGDPLSGKGFWLMIGILCLFGYHFTKVRYSVFQTNRANVFVIQDGQTHDKIVNEIKEKRRDLLIAQYGEIDSNNSVENEIGKFRWLQEQQVLTQEEAEIKIAQIEFRHRSADASSPLV